MDHIGWIEDDLNRMAGGMGRIFIAADPAIPQLRLVLPEIPPSKQLYRSTCEPLPPGSDFRESVFEIERREYTRDELVSLGFLPANNTPDEQ